MEHGDGEHVLSVLACRLHALPSSLLRAACFAPGADAAQHSHIPGAPVAQRSTAPRRSDKQAGRHFTVQAS